MMAEQPEQQGGTAAGRDSSRICVTSRVLQALYPLRARHRLGELGRPCWGIWNAGFSCWAMTTQAHFDQLFPKVGGRREGRGSKKGSSEVSDLSRGSEGGTSDCSLELLTSSSGNLWERGGFAAVYQLH